MMPLRWLWDKAVATALKSDGHTHYCVVGQVRHEAIRRRVRTVSHSEQWQKPTAPSQVTEDEPEESQSLTDRSQRVECSRAVEAQAGRLRMRRACDGRRGLRRL
jgi:hypothetical protein